MAQNDAADRGPEDFEPDDQEVTDSEDLDTQDTDEDEDTDGSPEESEADRRHRETIEENKRYRAKNRQHRAEIDTLRKENEALKKAHSGEADQAGPTAEEIATLRGDLDAALKENDLLRIQNAFVSNAKYTWENPSAALRLADLSDVEIDEDGRVVGLDEALDALAKSEPYLLKKGPADEDAPRRTGAPSGKRTAPSVNREALLQKYPALRR